MIELSRRSMLLASATCIIFGYKSAIFAEAFVDRRLRALNPGLGLFDGFPKSSAASSFDELNINGPDSVHAAHDHVGVYQPGSRLDQATGARARSAIYISDNDASLNMAYSYYAEFNEKKKIDGGINWLSGLGIVDEITKGLIDPLVKYGESIGAKSYPLFEKRLAQRIFTVGTKMVGPFIATVEPFYFVDSHANSSPVEQASINLIVIGLGAAIAVPATPAVAAVISASQVAIALLPEGYRPIDGYVAIRDSTHDTAIQLFSEGSYEFQKMQDNLIFGPLSW